MALSGTAFPNVGELSSDGSTSYGGTLDFTADSASRALKIEFSKMRKYEPRQAKDLISGLFSLTENKSWKTTRDYIGKATSSAADGTASDERNMFKTINRKTLDPKVIQMRRRENEARAREISHIVPKLHAKKVGETPESWAAAYRKAVEARVATDMQSMAIDLMLSAYKENMVLDGLPTGGGTTVRFPRSQYSIPLPYYNHEQAADAFNSVSGASLGSLSLDIRTFMGIEAEFNNALGQTFNSQSGMDMVLDNVSRICIMPESGYAQFVSANYKYLANKDFFGRNITVDGYGQFRELHGFLITTVPDETFGLVPGFSTTAKFTEHAANAAKNTLNGNRQFLVKFQKGSGADAVAADLDTHPEIRALANAANGFTLRGVGSDVANGDVFTDGGGMYPAIFVARDAFELFTPTQLKMSPKVWTDDQRSFETKIFGMTPCEGIRHFDQLIRVVAFKGLGQTTNYKIAA